jgi:glycerophosphoryl diester phosphodiesterase
MTKQELDSSKDYTNSETKPMKKSVNTTTTKSNQELQLIKDQDIFISNLMQGRTLTECITDKKINQQQISFQKFYAILKKNPDLEGRILEARKIGIQTLIDKLMQIFQYQETNDPNSILFIREKTKFVQWVAGKLTDLYSDNKVQNIKTDQRMTITWEDTPDLIDVGATDVTPTPPKE